MTRDERIQAAVSGYCAERNDDARTFRDAITSALDAALADLGGLDGLDGLLGKGAIRQLNDVRADRDRLREALRVYVGVGPHSPAKREWDAMCAALHESEAGT